jgi:WD40 repeat protein
MLSLTVLENGQYAVINTIQSTATGSTRSPVTQNAERWWISLEGVAAGQQPEVVKIDEYIESASASPQGQHVIYEETHLWSNACGQEMQVMYTPAPGKVAWPLPGLDYSLQREYGLDWSPAGSHLVFAAKPYRCDKGRTRILTSTLFLWDAPVHAGEALATPRPLVDGRYPQWIADGPLTEHTAPLQNSTPISITETEQAATLPSPQPPTPRPVDHRRPNPTPTPATTTPDDPNAWISAPLVPPATTLTTSTVQHIAELQRLGKGQIEQVDWSADGDLLAVASPVGAFLYATDTWEEVQTLPTSARVNRIAFTPDSSLLALAITDTVRLWHVADQRWLPPQASSTVRDTLLPLTSVDDEVTFLPDGTLLILDGNEVWNAQTDTLLSELQNIGDTAYMAFASDGRTLITGSSESAVKQWDIADGSLLRTLGGHNGRVHDVAFAPDGSIVASAASNGSIKFWDAADGSLLRIIDAHTDGIVSITFSPDSTTLASGSEDGTVKVWSVADGSLQHTIEGYTDPLTALALSADGTLLATSEEHSTVRVWNYPAGTLRLSLQGYAQRIIALDFSPTSPLLAFGPDLMSLDRGYRGSLQVWDVRGEPQRQMFEDDDASQDVEDVTFSPDGSLLASGDSGRLNIWNVSERTLLDTQPWDTDGIIAFAPNDMLIAYAIGSKVAFWSVPDGTTSHRFFGDIDRVNSLAFSPDGTLLGLGMGHDWQEQEYDGIDDKIVQIWNVADGTRLHTLEGHRAPVTSVAFSPDGHIFASASEDDTIKLWSVADGTLQSTLTGHTHNVTGLAFSPDGTLLLSCSRDGTVRFWGVDAGR